MRQPVALPEDEWAVQDLIQPHGGRLVNLIVSEVRKQQLREASLDWPSWNLTPRQICDLELLLGGGFSPLSGFLGVRDFEAVCSRMRLDDGTLWPIPVTLDITEEVAETLSPGGILALRDPEGVMLAAIHVQEMWKIDREAKALSVFGTLDRRHPGVAHLFQRTHSVAVGGPLEGLQLPSHYDFIELRKTPAALRTDFARLGWKRIVAFQTRNPMHRAHFELTLRASRELDANLLIHPVVGMTRPGDIDHYTRVRCYQLVMNRYSSNTAMLALLPLAMRMGGPREALLHAIIRKNYGCTHFIVGRDHAGPGEDSRGQPFYAPYEAHELISSHAAELGIKTVLSRNVVYVKEKDSYYPEEEIPPGSQVLSLSGSELRNRLLNGHEIPEWFTFPEVAKELQNSHPPRIRQGLTIFFTGLSGAGKSTIANAIMIKLLEMGGRPVTLLDGDIVRKYLSSELGFSREHRDTNIRRIGFVASEITKNGGVAICAPIAPYDSVRQEVKEIIRPYGPFILVYVSTPLEICESRDRKGLYAKARAGLIENFTGISDPYEAPQNADVVIDTSGISPMEATQRVLRHLEREGYIHGGISTG